MCKQNGSPIATFALFAYNQERYIREAVAGALAQEFSSLHIILSDDCSTDSTFDIMKEMADQYDGPHSITLNRNIINLGVADHFNKLMDLAEGEIIIVASGDDISMPLRTRDSVNILLDNEYISMVTSKTVLIDENGVSNNDVLRGSLSRNPGRMSCIDINEFIEGAYLPVGGASRAFRKSVFDKFGPLGSACPTEDTPMLLRCLMCGNAAAIGKVGVKYRRHGDNLSGLGSILKMPHHEIAMQYLTDLRVAHDLDLIESTMLNKVTRWIAGDMIKRSVKRGYYAADSRMRFFVSNIMFSGSLSLRSKCMYAIRSITRAV